MAGHSRTMILRPPGMVTRLWYRWYCGIRPPMAECASREIKSLRWARWMPARFRVFHRRYATRHGLFWLPCVLCTRPYGGHQSAGSVPDPFNPPRDSENGPWFYVGICPRCSRRRRDTQ